jgi:signal transduction histidine kinase
MFPSEEAVPDSFTVTHRAKRKDGGFVWLESIATTIRDPHTGQITEIQTSARDITTRREAEERAVAREAELEATVDQLRRIDAQRRDLLQRLIGSEEATRRRIADDLNKDSIQAMAAAEIRVEMLASALLDPDLAVVAGKAASSIRETMQRMRRLVADLDPGTIEREGLAGALRRYLQVVAVELGLGTSVEDQLGSDQPSHQVKITAYRIAHEAVANALKHSGATRIDVRLEPRDQGIYVSVGDDGEGFDPTAVERSDHNGISAIRERAEVAGGWLRVSSEPGAGSLVEFWLPPAY